MIETLPGMGRIHEIINTALHTVFVKDNIPMSLILVSPSGGGKSSTLLQWEAPWIHHTSDLTSAGLIDIIENDRDNNIHTIILPDFNLALSHKSAVTNLTVANLLSLMTDGVIRIDDGRHKKEVRHAPLSLVTAVTPDMYFSHFRRWYAIGLLRRFLLVNYDYSLDTRMQGRKLISQDKVSSNQLKKVQLTLKQVHTLIQIPSETDSQIEQIAIELAQHLGIKLRRNYKTGQIEWNAISPALEFSPIIAMRTMARAHAILHDNLKVTDKDVQFLLDLVRFTNPGVPEKI
jgi:hypothetical protein